MPLQTALGSHEIQLPPQAMPSDEVRPLVRRREPQAARIGIKDILIAVHHVLDPRRHTIMIVAQTSTRMDVADSKLGSRVALPWPAGFFFYLLRIDSGGDCLFNG